MNFIAIDFETANHLRSSACQIGLAKVVDNKIVDTKCFFIKPVPDYFEPINIRIHGIKEGQTKNASTFDVLWESELKDYLKGYPLVAHNAPFEKSVFNALATVYPIEVPHIYDTLRLSRHYCSDLFNFRLDTVCDHLNVPLGRHHNAEDDAVGCAGILLSIAQRMSADDIDFLFESAADQCGPRSVTEDVFCEEAQRFKADEDCIRDKVFCFTGTLSFIRREVAAKVIEAAGGIYKDNISSKVNYLVVGDLSMYGQNSGKLKKVIEYREKGIPVEVLSETQFAEMVVYEGRTITPEMIAHDSAAFLDANLYNVFSGKNVCISEGFPQEIVQILSHRGAYTGVTFWENEAHTTDFFLMSNPVIQGLQNGLKTPSIIRMEDALNKQANPGGNPDNHHIKFINEEAIMEFFKRVDSFVNGKGKMRLAPTEEPHFVSWKQK